VVVGRGFWVVLGREILAVLDNLGSNYKVMSMLVRKGDGLL
jgi:hypothetical protein